MIPHNEIEKFFQEWDPSMNIHTIAEIISRSVDWDLVEMLKGLQCLFPFTPDKLKGILENFDGEKDRELMKANLERILKVLAKIWREHGSADFTKLSENAELKDIIDYLPLAAFLLSCTSRDSSFLIRVAITHNKNDNLHIVDKWDRGSVKVKDHHLKIMGYKDEHFQTPMEKMAFKFSKGGLHIQKGDVEEKELRFKSKCNLVDVSMKPWNKLYSIMNAEHKVNQKFVNYFIENMHANLHPADKSEDDKNPVSRRSMRTI